MGNMEGQRTKYNGSTHPIFSHFEQQILNFLLTTLGTLKELPEKQKPSKVWHEGKRLAHLFVLASAQAITVDNLGKKLYANYI